MAGLSRTTLRGLRDSPPRQSMRGTASLATGTNSQPLGHEHPTLARLFSSIEDRLVRKKTPWFADLTARMRLHLQCAPLVRVILPPTYVFQVARFLPVAPALVRAVRGADAAAQAQAQALCDGLACAQALAGAPGGMDRLLRAGAAAAVVGRLCAASRDRATALGGVNLGGAERVDGIGGGEGHGGEGGGRGERGGVEESKAGGRGGGRERGEGANLPTRPSSEGFGAAEAATTSGGDSDGGGGGGGPAEKSEALAFAFVGRTLEASGGNCLGARELTALAGAFRDDPTPAKFGFLDLLLRWAALQEERGSAPAIGPRNPPNEGERTGGAGGAPWAKRGPFPDALREGLLQALHGAAADVRRDAALALLASLLRAAGQEWAVEDDSDDGGNVGARSDGNGGGNAPAAVAATGKTRKRGTFVAFAVRCAAGEVRILLDEALSLFVPAATVATTAGAEGEAEEEFQEKARGAMSPAGIDPAIGVAAERIAAAASAADGGGGSEGRSGGGNEGEGRERLPARKPLSAAAVKAIKEQRTARLLRMVPVGLGVAESTIAFLCGGGDEEEEENREGQGEGEGEGQEEGGSRRWEGLPIETLQDLQKVTG